MKHLVFASLLTLIPHVASAAVCPDISGDYVGTCNSNPKEYKIEQTGCDTLTINGKAYKMGMIVNTPVTKDMDGYTTEYGEWTQYGAAIKTTLLAKDTKSGDIRHYATTIDLGPNQDGSYHINYAYGRGSGSSFVWCDFTK
ncbi:hypothetical protein K2X33_16345 [bacterium]|nr:hypothetical protein [bacterium]